ncbi:MAG: type II toxin-antitoxin system RelE/ParE family toxin [Gammaproteobacteria bacterium]|nr:type II toxin-antitoxin system RelE/ParE family toxin [Gammaproteobacteria bacterium]MBU1655526.1 type II toxin-antitoxin system RelE/ParE family toxin [Gammaproteobacteria bacterium]MBU1961274.1 type II toxin-antitoxin system RelE/ParE family toxin [Gammaproteobacteria bacterium]
MFEIIKTHVFDVWLTNLRDFRARARIQARIDRMALGNLGDVKPVGGGVSEARIYYGPSYRLYFIQDGMTVIVLLSGGDKDSQEPDIAEAKRLAQFWRQEK